MSYDAALWGALACALSALIAVLSWQRAKRTGFRAGVRGAAWALLPLAAWLTGTLRLLTEILGDVGDWAQRLVFSPAVWIGVVLAGLAVVLFAISARMPGAESSRRSAGRRRDQKVKRGGSKAVGAADGSGMDDIEAILRKHGIS